MSQGELAKKAKLAPTTLCRLIRGSGPRTGKQIRKIAQVLDLDLATLAELATKERKRTNARDFSPEERFTIEDIHTALNCLKSAGKSEVSLDLLVPLLRLRRDIRD